MTTVLMLLLTTGANFGGRMWRFNALAAGWLRLHLEIVSFGLVLALRLRFHPALHGVIRLPLRLLLVCLKACGGCVGPVLEGI